MEWLFRGWSLIFWLPLAASAGAGWFALSIGILHRPAPLVLWFTSAVLLQTLSAQFSPVWVAGLVTQSALAIYLTLRSKLQR